MALELAKSLKLVAPISMSGEDQLAWIGTAIDALEGIRVDELQAVSTELRRKVTRPSQIVPEIANLVAAHRQRRTGGTEAGNPKAEAEMRISEAYRAKIGAAKNQAEVEAAWAWERRERINAGLKVPPIAPPLTRDELDHLPDNIVSMGLTGGFLRRINGQLVESTQHTGGLNG